MKFEAYHFEILLLSSTFHYRNFFIFATFCFCFFVFFPIRDPVIVIPNVHSVSCSWVLVLLFVFFILFLIFVFFFVIFLHIQANCITATLLYKQYGGVYYTCSILIFDSSFFSFYCLLSHAFYKMIIFAFCLFFFILSFPMQ